LSRATVPQKGRQAKRKEKKEKKRSQSRLLKAGFFLKGKKKERKEKKKDAWMPALVVPWGEIPPDPPFNPPANKHPHPPPLGRKGKKEKKKKPDACFC